MRLLPTKSVSPSSPIVSAGRPLGLLVAGCTSLQPLPQEQRRPADDRLSDFAGKLGCALAGGLCQGIGGRNTMAFDAQALHLGGGTAVYLTMGNGTTPVRVVRID